MCPGDEIAVTSLKIGGCEDADTGSEGLEAAAAAAETTIDFVSWSHGDKRRIQCPGVTVVAVVL